MKETKKDCVEAGLDKETSETANGTPSTIIQCTGAEIADAVRRVIEDGAGTVKIEISTLTAKLYGILYYTRDFYGIESATVDGKAIPIAVAGHIFGALEYGRVWYDFVDDEFHFNGSKDVFTIIISRIKELADGCISE